MSSAFTTVDESTLSIEIGDLLPPERRRYRMLGHIGEGHFSMVWLARDLQQKERTYVAIKIDKATKSPGPSAETLVLRKVRSYQKGSKHPGAPHVIHLIDDFVVKGRQGHFHSCIVTEVVISIGSRWYIMRNRCMLLQPFVNAFTFLHGHGIAHGDPHANNVGVVVENLNAVPEETLEPDLKEGFDWHVILEGIDIDGSEILPSNGASASLRVFDFGRAYKTSSTCGRAPYPIPGCNPYRPPEVFIYRMSNQSLGLEWSFASDVWALACTLNEVCRQHLLRVPPSDDSDMNWGLMTRCAPGGPPPSEWLRHCDFGHLLLDRFKIFEGYSPPQSLVDNPKSKDAVIEGLDVATKRFWVLESKKLKGDPASLPIESFSDMIKGMTETDPLRRSTMAEVVEHPFWKQFADNLALEKFKPSRPK